MLVVDDEVLKADDECNCPSEACDCAEAFTGTCVDPESDEAINQANNHMKQTSTYKALHKWFFWLTFMHTAFCNVAYCKGIPNIDNITDDENIDSSDCIYCCESVWALRWRWANCKVA